MRSPTTTFCALLSALPLAACATAGSSGPPARLVGGDTHLVLAVVREELSLDRVPLDRNAEGGQVRSVIFDPRTVWTDAEIAGRIACVDARKEPVAPGGRMSLWIAVEANPLGSSQTTQVVRPASAAMPARVIDQSLLSLRSSGSVHLELQRNGRCALSEPYAKELIARVAGRFPRVDREGGINRD